MKKKCPYCNTTNTKQQCGYFQCSNCYKWYLPMRDGPESKGDLKEFLDSEENEKA